MYVINKNNFINYFFKYRKPIEILIKCHKMYEKNQESLTIDMVQNNQKLLLYIIFHAFIREWIILDKDSP